MSIEDLQTGDLILFSGKGWFSWAIEWVTKSDFSHCGIVLRDPDFLHPSLKGLYLWESGWEGIRDVEDRHFKLGVQITPLHEALSNYKGKVYYRKLHTANNQIDSKVLNKIHQLVHDRPYDVNPLDWIEAYLRKDPEPQKTSRMFCSAFASLVYTKCDILDPKTDWSIVRPSDLAYDINIHFTSGCKFEKLIQLI